MGWEKLPSPCLLGVLELLDAHDRLSVRDVCSSWADVSSSPASWKYLRINVSRGDQRARIRSLLAAVGKGVRRLNLIWDLRSGEDFSVYYLKALVSAQVSLASLSLTNASHSYKLNNRTRMLFLIAKLLRSGRVDEVCLEGAWLRGGELTRLLRNCGTSLKRLHISGASRTPPAHALHAFLQQLPHLNQLTLDSSAISGELVRALSQGAPNLRRLDVRARLQQFPPIPGSAWAALTTSHPKLTVSMEIYSMLRHDHLCSCLHADIPLVSFSWCCEQLSGEAPIGEIIRRVLQTIANNYSHCLEVLVVQTKCCNESMDDTMIEILKICKRLQTFHFQGFVRSLKTVSEIMTNDEEKRISFIEVQPKYLTLEQRVVVERILKVHEVLKPNLNLKLRIRDPVPLTAYY